MTDRQDEGFAPTRRIVFSGLASLGVAVALAGCGSSSSDDSGSASGGSGSSSDSGSSSGDASGSPSSSASSSSGTELTKTGDVPVGGGVILTDKKIVVTQPKKGTFEAFSAVCTHQGFLVTSVSKNIILCDHHGSEYSAETGKVERGPAPKALFTVAIKVSGDSVMTA